MRIDKMHVWILTFLLFLFPFAYGKEMPLQQNFNKVTLASVYDGGAKSL